MCFSAQASFIASAGLIIAGVYSVRIATPDQKLLAAIPLLFGIQQGIEGLQWLHLVQGHSNTMLGYLFLMFAIAFWPIYIPMAMYQLEKKKRFISGLMVVLGIIVTSALVLNHITTPLTIEVIGRSISYRSPTALNGVFYGQLADILNLGYVLVVIISLYLSRENFFKLFAGVIVATAIVAYIFYSATYVSSWCFFSAIVSVSIIGYLKKRT